MNIKSHLVSRKHGIFSALIYLSALLFCSLLKHMFASNDPRFEILCRKTQMRENDRQKKTVQIHRSESNTKNLTV